jgi:hypothetical protein
MSVEMRMSFDLEALKRGYEEWHAEGLLISGPPARATATQPRR